MSQENFSDAALVLLGHGSTQNADSSASVFQHAAELRRRNRFGEVREAFWKQEPQVAEVLTRITARRVIIVPLFVSAGFFCENVIPKSLGFQLTADPQSRTRRDASRLIHYAQPVGTHDQMADLLLARAREVTAAFPFPRAPKASDTTLCIAGHGTSQDDNSRKSIERQAALLRGRNEYADVQAVFLEEEPRVGAVYQIASTRTVIVVPFFMSDGLHAQEDIPVLLGEPQRVVRERLAALQPAWRNPTERHGKLVWYARSVGTQPLLAEVILLRAGEAPPFSPA